MANALQSCAVSSPFLNSGNSENQNNKGHHPDQSLAHRVHLEVIANMAEMAEFSPLMSVTNEADS